MKHSSSVKLGKENDPSDSPCNLVKQFPHHFKRICTYIFQNKHLKYLVIVIHDLEIIQIQVEAKFLNILTTLLHAFQYILSKLPNQIDDLNHVIYGNQSVA
jgi:hypothetical protein